ncbi:hypothetical protein LXA43DRAFT_1066967 [Ganoderma leucocontextum]|nr:hypothetical protein LXA43DRAFT_1066967 [Ganoderma leucocontextum]
MDGGIDTLLESGSPARTIVLIVKAAPARESIESGGNPAKAFKLSNITIVKSDEHYAIAARSDEMQQRRNELNAVFRAGGQFSDDRAFAGMFCAAHVINKTGVVNHELFGSYHLPLRHVSNDHNDPRTRRALAQSVEFLSRVIASGVVLRYPKKPSSVEPERGRYAHTRGSWRFQPIQDDWESLGSLGNAAELRPMELTAREMVTLFDAHGSLLRFRLIGKLTSPIEELVGLIMDSGVRRHFRC